MASKLTIRKFLPSDIDKIVEIEKASFRQGAYSKTRLENLSKKHPNDFLVAQLADKKVGYIIAYNKAGGWIDFVSLAVDKKYQKLGIGKKLVVFVLNRFRKKGLKKASLEVRTTNKRAISFFQNLGFKTTKVIKRYYRDGEDAYLMEKSNLAPAKAPLTAHCSFYISRGRWFW